MDDGGVGKRASSVDGGAHNKKCMVHNASVPVAVHAERLGPARLAERAQSEEKCDKEESHVSLTNIDGNNSVRTLSLEARQ